MQNGTITFKKIPHEHDVFDNSNKNSGKKPIALENLHDKSEI